MMKNMNSLSKDALWYLCGPMTGKRQFNVPAFFSAEKVLKAKGLRVQLPFDLNDPEVVAQLMKSIDGNPWLTSLGRTWGDCVADDIKLIADEVDGVVVLPGWQRSRGGRLETLTAHLCIKPIVYYPSLEPVPSVVLAKAWMRDLE
jgi:hypothetical protein